MTAASPREVPLRPVFLPVTVGSTALAWAVLGSRAWGHHSLTGFVVSNAVGVVLFTAVWRFPNRPARPYPRTVPWKRAALMAIFMPLLFLLAGYFGMLSFPIDQFAGMYLARVRARTPELIDF